MTEAIGYTRLSQESDTSIDRQKRHIRAYADENGFDLQRIYDDGERSSGFDTQGREEYQQLRQRVVDGAAGAVIVNDKRRLARDIDEVMRLIPDLRTNDVELHTHQDGKLDLSDPMRAAIEILMAAAAHEEKMEEIQKAIEAVEERKENGYYHGRVPYGLKFDDAGKYLVPDPDEFETLQEVLTDLDRDVSYREIESNTGVPIATISRINERGREFYEGRV